MAPSGQGYLIDAKLPRLDAKQTYQLWGLSDGNAISLGLLGGSPTQAAFHVDFAQVSQLMITVEPVGGVAQPNSPVVVSGMAVMD
jgi:anti-sigma-K factor RskA